MVDGIYFWFFILVCAIIARRDAYNKGQYIANLIGTLIIGTIGSLAVIAVLSVIIVVGFGSMSEGTVVKKQEIYSLRNAGTVDGTFFLGTGSVRGWDYYSSFIKTDDGFFKRKEFDADDTLIKEVVGVSHLFGTQPYYERVTYKNCSKINRILFGSLFECFDAHKEEFKLYVPRNTVIQEFRVE